MAQEQETRNSVDRLATRLRENGDPPTELSLEDILLVQLSRSFLVPEVLRTLEKKIQGRVDWDVFLKGARRHNLLGFIHYHCSTHKVGLPSKIMANILERNAIASTA